jgi:hypothetical protein
VIRRLSIGAAAQARADRTLVWIQVDGRWVAGRIREVIGGDAVLELSDRTSTTVPLTDVHDTPPPGVSLGDQANPLQVALPTEAGSLAGSGATEASSPQVQHYYQLLVQLSEEERRQAVRRLFLKLHSDKGGGDDVLFNALITARNLIQSGGAGGIDQATETLMLTGPVETAVTPVPPSVPRPGLQPAPPQPSLSVVQGTPETRPTPVIEPGRELPGQPFSASEIQLLSSLPAVRGPGDLARLAGLGVRASDLAAVGRLPVVTTTDHIAALVRSGRSPAEIAQLDAVPQVANGADLVQLAYSAFPSPRLTTLAAFVQVRSLNDLLTAAALALSTNDLILLTTVPQATIVADLATLGGAALPAADLVVIAGLGGPMFTPPTVAEIVELCSLGRSAAQILQLAGAEGVTNSAQLVALVERTKDTERVDVDWEAFNQRFDVAQGAWRTRWPIPMVFAAIDLGLGQRNSLLKRLPYGGRRAADADLLQQYAMLSARLGTMLDLLDRLAPAIDEGMGALTEADRRHSEVTRLIDEIDSDFLQYYTAPSAAHTTVTNQRALLVLAQAALDTERTATTADKATYAGLAALTDAIVTQAVNAQHNHRLALDGITATNLLEAPLVALRTVGYQDRRAYPNLNLGPQQTGHAFWQLLNGPERTLWNNKLAGHRVISWSTAGHPPATAHRPHVRGYGGPLLIPRLAGFPALVSGEIVYDWIFGTPGHGHAASVMAGMLTKALGGLPHNVRGLGPLAPDNDTTGPGRTVYGWRNISTRIVMTNGANPTLITYYNPS